MREWIKGMGWRKGWREKEKEVEGERRVNGETEKDRRV